jgi:hypothetical protein
MFALSADYYQNILAHLFVFVVVAIVIERALYQVFDMKLWRWLESALDRNLTGGQDLFDLKPWINKAVCIWLVFSFDVDMVSTIFVASASVPVTKIITGLWLSGGATGVYKTFKAIKERKKQMSNNNAKAGLGASR